MNQVRPTETREHLLVDAPDFGHAVVAAGGQEDFVYNIISRIFKICIRLAFSPAAAPGLVRRMGLEFYVR